VKRDELAPARTAIRLRVMGMIGHDNGSASDQPGRNNSQKTMFFMAGTPRWSKDVLRLNGGGAVRFHALTKLGTGRIGAVGAGQVGASLAMSTERRGLRPTRWRMC
jgi:hypothetical protein